MNGVIVGIEKRDTILDNRLADLLLLSWSWLVKLDVALLAAVENLLPTKHS
jgi:hypothetical protein